MSARRSLPEWGPGGGLRAGVRRLTRRRLLLLQLFQVGRVFSASPELLERGQPVVRGRIDAKAAHLARIRNAACQRAMRLDQVELRELPHRTQQWQPEGARHPILKPAASAVCVIEQL